MAVVEQYWFSVKRSCIWGDSCLGVTEFHVDRIQAGWNSPALPGANCGACGFPGCSGLAASIVAGDARVNACPVSGSETASRIAAIMGVEPVTETEKKVARVLCQGTDERCAPRYVYWRTSPMQGSEYGCRRRQVVRIWMSRFRILCWCMQVWCYSYGAFGAANCKWGQMHIMWHVRWCMSRGI